MTRALGLAKQAGMTIHTDDAEYVAMLQNFYALARADLKADLAATMDLAEDYAQERNELKAENAKLKEVLERLARLGNGEHYGNSDGNMIARAALGETK